MHKMDLRFHASVAQLLKFTGKVLEEVVATQELLLRDTGALEDMDTRYQLTEVVPVLLGEQMPKQCRAKTIDV
jgi:hypothetical protein